MEESNSKYKSELESIENILRNKDKEVVMELSPIVTNKYNYYNMKEKENDPAYSEYFKLLNSGYSIGNMSSKNKETYQGSNEDKNNSYKEIEKYFPSPLTSEFFRKLIYLIQNILAEEEDEED